MSAAPRPSWLFHFALACMAMVCVWLAGASIAERPLQPSQHAVRDVVASGFRFESEPRLVAINHSAPIDRASARLTPTERVAFQRSGGRRGQRTASSHISGVERAFGTIARSAYDRRSSAPTVARFHVHRRDGRLGSAPTRAPPTHR